MRTTPAAALTVLGFAAAAAGGYWVLRAGADSVPDVRTPVVEAPAAAEGRPAMRDVAPRSRVERRVGPPTDPSPVKKKVDEKPDVDWESMTDDEQTELKQAMAERMQAEALAKFDTDGDGVSSAKEKDAARRRWAGEQEPSVEARRWDQLITDRFDSDGDGELSREERQARDAYFGPLKQRILSETVGAHDVDGDGTLTGAEKESAEASFEAGFDRMRVVFTLDRDRSGSIDAEELSEALAQIGAGSELLDLNLDQVTDSEDAIIAVSVAQSAG